ncbi:pyridoxal phosphate-dependent aminotransferase [Profundibacter sp.]|uniref:pyridoxal phosphate-dependent aminotransferase n=1 Tax=Profundibacter sp. TaxID=3101071 RepID=UPI003D122C37
MQLSNRITTLLDNGHDGWGLYLKSIEMIESGIPVTELTIGEHDIRTHPDILNAMHKSALGGHTGYAAVPGTDELRQAVAKRVQDRTGVPTTIDNVLITPGGQSALFSSHHAVCDEGDTALFIDPYYATYPATLRAVGAIATPVAAHAQDNFEPQAEAIAKHAKGAKSLLINTPNNPTGVVYSRATLNGIADVCRENDLWLISDEVYDTQIWQGEHLSPRALPDMAERTLVVGSMSKSHAMTGSRIGWIVAPEDAIKHLSNLATHTTYGVPGYIQDAALFALEQGPPLEAEIAAPFARRREIAMRVLDGQNVVKHLPAMGAMYLMLDLRATGLSGEDFAHALLQSEHIAVMPGNSFGQSAAGHIRVAMTVEDGVFGQALERLVGFAKGLVG